VRVGVFGNTEDSGKRAAGVQVVGEERRNIVNGHGVVGVNLVHTPEIFILGGEFNQLPDSVLSRDGVKYLLIS